MNKKDATRLCELFHESDLRVPGYGGDKDERWVDTLRAAFPKYNWRIILDSTVTPVKWAMTIDDDDPREK